MTQDFENMLYLFGANANGADNKLSGEIHADKIREEALKQGIWTMVYPELSKVCDIPEYKQEFLLAISKSITRKQFTLHVIKKIEEAGIKCCLLKGSTVAEFYRHPECRVSADTDILIDPAEEEHVKKILVENGYVVKDRKKNHHHAIAVHESGGRLEVHVSLYDKVMEKILFNNACITEESWETVVAEGKRYHVLGTKDTLMYLTVHYIKHFINSGSGVRQMMDLLLFMEKNKEKIDFEAYDKVLKELKYDKLIDVVKTVGAKYFGFSYEIKEETLAERVLTDTEIGGVFGHSAENRGGFYAAYCLKRTTMSKAQAKLFMQRKSETRKKLFPDQKSLIEGYGYRYAKHKILMPVAWVHRYVDVILGTRKPEVATKDTAEFQERMKLMQDLGMIDE